MLGIAYALISIILISLIILIHNTKFEHPAIISVIWIVLLWSVYLTVIRAIACCANF